MAEPEKIAQAARECASVAAEAIRWFEDAANSDKVGAERSGLVRDLRRITARSQKLAVAAERPMCVGVFGPSQAGKSFLVSVLARPEGGKLVARYGDRDLDFIREINPEGEGESTGLVTRFTLRAGNGPSGYPVGLRLLTEIDVVRILANTYLMDGDLTHEKEPDKAAIEALLARWADRRNAPATGGITADDLLETQEYLEKQFGTLAHVKALEPFWEGAAAIAPALDRASRAEFMALLWGGHEPFTALYQRLGAALDQLGHPTDAFAPITALNDPELRAQKRIDARSESIIDVKTLAGIDGDDRFTPLEIVAAGGGRATLPRPVVTALVAELQLPMAERPYPLFDHTDLLDFPGARSRFKRRLKEFFAEGGAPLAETFLRGKVAYLFDRYVAEQELTSMLLCIPPSNLEVVDLPGLVEGWVGRTHGRTPAERTGNPCLLFFVLTKFDMHLTDSAGASDDASSRFQRRMEASLLAKFADYKDSWPNNWEPGRPFDNCYWLRNPNYPARAVIDYDDDKRELSLRQDAQKLLAELRDGCITAPLVRTHFAEPERAWDAAMTLNDGGVSLLVEKLEPVCRPEIKARQVEVQLERQLADLRPKLERFFVSSDSEKRLEERRAVARQAAEAIYQCFDYGHFGRFLASLMVDSSALADHLERLPSHGEGVRIVHSTRSSPTGQATQRPLPGGRPLPGSPRPLPGDPAPPPAQAAAETTAMPRLITRAQFLADAALRFWLDQVHALPEQTSFAGRYSLAPVVAGEIISELAAGTRRLAFAERLAEAIERASFIEKGEVLATKPAILCAHRINAYVGHAGVLDDASGSRPTAVDAEGNERPVFAPPPIRHDAGGLGERPLPFADDLVTDWVFALFRLFEDNAQSEVGAVADPEQNRRLGSLLERLESVG